MLLSYEKRRRRSRTGCVYLDSGSGRGLSLIPLNVGPLHPETHVHF
jgi:hypothetical protein